MIDSVRGGSGGGFPLSRLWLYAVIATALVASRLEASSCTYGPVPAQINAEDCSPDDVLIVGADGCVECAGPLAGAASDAESYITMSNTAGLSAERSLLAGAGLTKTDGGANSTVTVDVGAGTCLTVNANDVAVACAPALAANGANCSAGQFPLGVDAAGAVESCSSTLSGNASTATALAANGANCSAGSYPLGVDASGAAESCTVAYFQTVQDEGVALGQFNTIDFTGTSIACGAVGGTKIGCNLSGITAGAFWNTSRNTDVMLRTVSPGSFIGEWSSAGTTLVRAVTDTTDGAVMYWDAGVSRMKTTGTDPDPSVFKNITPLTTKGDLIGDDGTDPGRLAVGSNGQQLVADSAQTLGLKWQTPVKETVFFSGSTGTLSATGTLTSLVYPGSTAHGGATYVLHCNVYRTAGGSTCAARITDLTNTTTLCTSGTTTSGTNTTILDCGAVTNVPAAEAILGFDLVVGAGTTCASPAGCWWTVAP